MRNQIHDILTESIEAKKAVISDEKAVVSIENIIKAVLLL